MKAVSLYDTTLRDGAQREHLSFSLADKLKITKGLDVWGLTSLRVAGQDPIPRIEGISNRFLILILHMRRLLHLEARAVQAHMLKTMPILRRCWLRERR